MRVGFLQFAPRFGRVEENGQLILDALRDVEADLLVLPELSLTGYSFKDRAELERLAENPLSSDFVQELSWLLAARNLHVVVGLAEKVGSRIYNSALLVGPLGILHTYRKLHLFDAEKELFDPGDLPLQVVEVKEARIGLMVCFDWAFCEVARALALQGADLLCHPSNLVLDHGPRTMQTRCLENGVFAITANRTGSEKRAGTMRRFTGRSQLVAPDGTVVLRAPAQRRAVQVIEVDLRAARDKKLTQRNHLLRDRRPAFYGPLCAEPPERV